MINRNTVRCSALAVIAALTLFSASTIARSPNQKAGEQPELSLMAKNDPIPDVDVVLIKKPGGKTYSGRTKKDGFSFANMPFGTYNFTFDAPKVSPALAGKVEYLIIVQQFEIRAADRTTTATQPTTDAQKFGGALRYPRGQDAKSNTVKRVRIVDGDYGKEGFDFVVGPQPQDGRIVATKPVQSESETRKAQKDIAPQAMNVCGKIFLVEIGTTKIVFDQSGVKAPNQ